VEFFSRIPFSTFSVSTPKPLEIVSIYLAVAAVLSWQKRKQAAFFGSFFIIALAGDGLFLWQGKASSQNLRVTFLNVGQGDAAVVELPNSRVLLIDAGGSATGEFDTGDAVVIPFLRSRRIARLDYVFLSHPRIDHYGGLRSVVEEYPTGEFWEGPLRGETVRYHELEETLASRRIHRVTVSKESGCRLVSTAEICFLHPSKAVSKESSAVVTIAYGRHRFLFAGDIGRRDEKWLAENEKLSSDVLKIPRHGSQTSSGEEFVNRVKPGLAVLSVGDRSRLGLPSEEVLARYEAAGSEILRTDRDGAIAIESDGQSLRYWTYRTKKSGRL